MSVFSMNAAPLCYGGHSRDPTEWSVLGSSVFAVHPAFTIGSNCLSQSCRFLSGLSEF